MKKKLADLREQINKIDGKMIDLLNERANVAISIGKIKKEKNKQIYAPEREKEVYRSITTVNKGPLQNFSLKAIYREIMSATLNVEHPIKIAYLGPPATFAHLASLKKFGASVDYLPCDSIRDVFFEVEKERADYGVVPIENSTEGVITHTLDMFIDSDLKICSEISLEISHNLLTNIDKNKIKRVYSNPYVFGQCRHWLEENLPAVEHVEVSSTTKAAEFAKKDKNGAAIASSLAAKIYGLKILASSIEDSSENVTRFLVIGREEAGQTSSDKTSIMFSIKDRVGVLHDTLVPFQKYKINLTKIESRPSKKKAWDYYFFVDLEGHHKDKKVKKALEELIESCRFLKILGSYPLGEK
ncbi:MAG: prephenate dehydratase [Candidatus Omnitrophota bacterium]